MIDCRDAELPITIQAELLGLNRSSLYYKPVEPSPEEIFIKHKIDEIYTKDPYFGSRRITVTLNNSGININRKAVQRHMREMGIAGIPPGPNLSKRNLEHRIYPYLLRNLAITHPKAKGISFQQGAVPIVLMNGIGIVNIMIEKGVGVVKKPLYL